MHFELQFKCIDVIISFGCLKIKLQDCYKVSICSKAKVVINSRLSVSMHVAKAAYHETSSLARYIPSIVCHIIY